MKVYDLEGNEHEKESVDVRECVEILGWSRVKPEPVVVVEEIAQAPATEIAPQATELTIKEMTAAIKAAGAEIPKGSSDEKIKEIFDSLKTAE